MMKRRRKQKKTMNSEEIKRALEKMDVSTARSRAKVNGRAICLDPPQSEVDMDTRLRADGYVDCARSIAKVAQAHRVGIKGEELEKLELAREILLDLAKDVTDALIVRG